MDIKKIRTRWKPKEPHKDSTLDYAISEIYKLCDEIDELQAHLDATERCIDRQQIKAFHAKREENSIQFKDFKAENKRLEEIIEKAIDATKDKCVTRYDEIDSKQTYKWIMRDMFNILTE